MDVLEKILNWDLISIGGKQLTLGSVIGVVVILLATWLVATIAGRATTGFFNRLSAKDKSAARTYGTLVKLLVWLVGLEFAMHNLGFRPTSMFAAGGAFAIGAGLAAKTVIGNLFAGCVIRFEKEVRRGDLVIIDDRWVTVESIGLRTTKARTYDGQQVLIPNSLVSDSMVWNLSRGDRLHRIEALVGVSYESDLDQVRKVIEETCDKLDWRSHAKPPRVYLEEFGGSSVNYAIDVWIDDADESRGRSSDLREAVWHSLKKAGIVIAYPQLDVHMDPSAKTPTDAKINS